MQAAIIGIGLCMLVLAGGLAGVGHYDGVLGTVTPEALQGNDLPQDALLRVRVTGTVEEARSHFLTLRATFVLPGPMERAMEENRWIPVEILFPDGQARPAFLEDTGDSWAKGSILVVKGTPRAYWPLMERGADLEPGGAVLFIHPETVREPVLFKS